MLTFQQTCIVDFDWRLNYWPGNKQTKTYLIFLAGVIHESSSSCTFVSPNEIRSMLGLYVKVPKKEMHRTAKILYPEISKVNNHEIDAFLLYRWGKKNESG